MIIETSSNQFFRVREFNQPMDHAWAGFPVKRFKGAWVRKIVRGEPAREIIVRKAATRVVEGAL